MCSVGDFPALALALGAGCRGESAGILSFTGLDLYETPGDASSIHQHPSATQNLTPNKDYENLDSSPSGTKQIRSDGGLCLRCSWLAQYLLRWPNFAKLPNPYIYIYIYMHRVASCLSDPHLQQRLLHCQSASGRMCWRHRVIP